MTIKTLYRELLATLQTDGYAAVESVYQVDGGVEKRVVGLSDSEAWAKLEQFKTQADTTISGPVASRIADDGTVTVVESYSAKPRLIILGGGHVGLAVAEIGKLVDFEILLYDDRPSFANTHRFAQADSVICDGFDKLFERVTVRKTDYVIIVTRGHKHDAACLEGILAGVEPAYTGMIGSKRRVAIVLDQLKRAGFDLRRIEKIHSPIGLKIGAVTPAEIAISIMAEIIAVKRVENAGGALTSCDLEIVTALAEEGDSAEALITIYNTIGSVPIDTGAKLSTTYTGDIKGTIGGGCSESEALQIAREVIREGGWRTHMVDMKDTAEEDGMVCGGEMYVLIERVND
jgi:xanthine dehydrogenase accessory factor